MTLTDAAREMLSSVYANYKRTGSLEKKITYSLVPAEKKAQIDVINQLITAELVEKESETVSSVELRLRKSGIEYFEVDTQQVQQPVFNITVSGNVENSIIGNQTHAVIQNGSDLQHIMELIKQVGESDRELLSSLPDILLDIEKDGTASRGVLSKFNGALSKYPELFNTVGSFVIKLLLDSPL